MTSSKPKKANIAESVRNLLSSFIHSSSTSETTTPTPSRDANSSSLTSSDNVTSSRHEAFIRRVEGFSTLTWFSKPLELSPVRVARYGWENTGRDALRCVTCHQVLLCRLPSPFQDSYTKSVKDIEAKLVTAHRANCPWTVNPCQGLLLSDLVDGRDQALEMFLSRLVSLQNVSKLPPVDIDFTEDPMHVIDQLKQLVKESHLSGMLGLEEVSTSGCLLALCGWTIKSENTEVVTCSYCCRKVGIWKYLKNQNGGDKNDGAKNAEGDESEERLCKRKRLSVSEKEKFHPVNEHKHWCAWLLHAHNESSGLKEKDEREDKEGEKKQEEKIESLSGWKWFMFTLLPQLNPSRMSVKMIDELKTSPPHQALMSIRHLFNDWASADEVSVDLDKTPRKSSSTELSMLKIERPSPKRLQFSSPKTPIFPTPKSMKTELCQSSSVDT